MKITFLGSGSAFVTADENYHSNILLSKDVYTTSDNVYKHLLFDAGTTIIEALKAANYTVHDIDTICISHNHSDHTGGMELIGFMRYFKTFPFGTNIPRLVANTEVLEELWDGNLKSGMKSIQGKTCTIDTYFKTEYIAPNASFKFYGTDIELIQTVHVVDNRRIAPSYGIFFEEDDMKVFITGDCQMAPNQMMYFYEQANVIFHDCEFAEYPQSVHAQFHQLCTLPGKIKSKMFLYHYSLSGKSYEELDAEVCCNGFAGLVKRGQTFDLKINLFDEECLY